MIHIDAEKYQEEIVGLFRIGDRVIDEIRSDHFVDKTKLYWREVAFPFYESALNYCYKIKELDQAFYFFEKSKSVLLLEGYSFNEAISKISEEEKAKYLHLRSTAAKFDASANISTFEKRVVVQRSFEDYVDSLASVYPELFRGYQDLFLLSRSEFQNKITKDSSVMYVHYFCGEDSIYAYGITKNENLFINLGLSKNINALAADVQAFYSEASSIDNDARGYYDASQKLYQIALEPLIHLASKEIVILPDGPFSALPFESLVTNVDENGNPRFVIQDWVIRYSFSASLLHQMNDEEKRGRYDVLTFVPLSDNENMEQTEFTGVDENDFQRARKHGLSIKHYKGEKASKANLLSLGKRIPIIHFSSHGFDNSEVGPKIMLSDSHIALSELYTASIPADMVFLSACRTNLGELAFGEGVQSMSRGFTYAGAKSVISSLWNVVAGPNSKIVRLFYENLSKGQDKHLALHNAKLSYLEDNTIPSFEKSPYYWGGLVYYGEPDHILKPKSFLSRISLPKFGIILLIAFGLYFGMKLSLKRRKSA